MLHTKNPLRTPAEFLPSIWCDTASKSRLTREDQGKPEVGRWAVITRAWEQGHRGRAPNRLIEILHRSLVIDGRLEDEKVEEISMALLSAQY